MKRLGHSGLSTRRGFTFPEILAAMVFLGVVMPVAIQGVLTAARAGEAAQRKRTAASLADPLLAELIVTGEWIDGDSEGEFGEEWPGYRWELSSEPWAEDTVYQVDLSVFYQVQGKEYSIRLSTLAESVES
jgi:type II secretory pathway pseudopilin PulG